jgi:hypothetical protein
MSVVARLEVRGEGQKLMRARTRSETIPAARAQRARIVLLAGDRLSNAEIGLRVGAPPTVLH